MKIASVTELKKELTVLSHEELVKTCLQLAKYKKDNKELLNYLLFEAYDERGYVNTLKQEIAEEFANINSSSMYLVKKSIRRILRLVTKHKRYSGIVQTEIELLIFFCQQLRNFTIPIRESKAMVNLYQRQLKNIEKAMAKLDEDLKFDFQSEFLEVSAPLD